MDPFEKVSGTLGLSGAADAVLILDRDGSGATLYGRGRDVEEIEKAVSFDKLTCRWTILGQAAEVRRTDERAVILDLLADNHEPMSPAEIADALGLPRNLLQDGQSRRTYKKQERQILTPDNDPDNRDDHITPDNPDNHSNRGWDGD